jgi:peptidyl-dipeptidase Dcp
MVARILYPDLAAVFPNLKNPEEAAFIAVARDVMPVGMMGLLVSGIFAATMSSMDSGLNKNAGYFIKNFYQPIIKPNAPDAHLLRVSKIATAVLGIMVILVGLKLSELRGMDLFTMTQRLSILIGTPILVPLVLGIIVRRTPPWSAWSTVLVGFFCSLFISRFLTPEWAAPLFGYTGPLDNRPVAAEILQLRGELARLMGYPSFAHFALADRMARTPDTALALLERTWAGVKPRALAQIADYQALADREGAGIRLAPWDRQFYAEKLRRERFGLDGDAVKAHFPLDAVLQAMFWAAGRVHGLAFKAVAGAPLIHPTVRVFEVSRGDEVVGVIYFDLFNRPGKAHGSYQTQYREAEHFRGRVLPISGVYSTFPAPPDMDKGQPVLLPWEYANVFFHEFGHALHMLHCTSAYRSLGSQHVAWDFVELPALINERWLRDRELLARFARHHATGEPIAPQLVDRIEQGLKYDRIFSLNPDFLLPAIVDMRLHLRADGSGQPIDPVQVEAATLAELGMPEAWDLIMRVTHNFHCFIGAYAAGLYSYLWADVMAADAVQAFERAPGGLYDVATAKAWIDKVLSVGHRVAADHAFRDFAGHDPDPSPLHRRFGLA